MIPRITKKQVNKSKINAHVQLNPVSYTMDQKKMYCGLQPRRGQLDFSYRDQASNDDIE